MSYSQGYKGAILTRARSVSQSHLLSFPHIRQVCYFLLFTSEITSHPFLFLRQKIAKSACVVRFYHTKATQPHFESHKMSQAPEVATQSPLQDRKPTKDEILGVGTGGAGGAGGETGTGLGNDPINVKVVAANGEEVFFKIKRTTKLSKLQGAYANKVGKDVNSIRFLYDGTRINDDDTPDSLDMEDNDTIDVMVEQVGGSRRL